MVDRLRVTELDFDTIKANLKTFLKQQTEFQDYDFDGAGLSVLLDILAYNTHYNAYYLNMVANESFLDTALLRDSVVSHAKTLGYVPYSARSPVAIIDFTIESNNTTAGTCTLPQGFSFLSSQIDSKAYNFVVLQDTTVTKSNTKYIFEDLQIYEGQLITYSFTYDKSSNPKSLFQLPDPNIDTTTLRISVTPNSANSATRVYQKVTDVLEINSNSEVYYLQEGRGGLFQIYFGNGVVGKSLPDGAIVSATYLVTSATEANKANTFIATSSVTDSIGTSLTNFTITPQSLASGGAERESVDSIKFSSAARFSTQNRLVTNKDYATYILNSYPNIDSISVWGGEDNDPPVYGKIFVSLKPRENYYISEAEKQRIIAEIINPKSIISVSAEIIDPTFLYFVIEIDVRYDPKKTTATDQKLKEDIRNAVIEYNNTYLNKFSSRLVDSKLELAIDNVDLNAIIGNQLTIKAQKRFVPNLNQNSTYNVDFGIPLKRGTTTSKLSSTEFTVRDASAVVRTVLIEEVPVSYTGISSISVTNPGLNYTAPPTVIITGDGTGATAEAVIVNGRIKEILVTNRGIDYSRAVITLSGGGSTISATATAQIDAKIGTLRTIYYDANAQRQIVDSNVGEINYETGKVTLVDVNILSVNSTDGQMRITVESEKGIIETKRNTIITIDKNDPGSIVTTLVAVSS
jgi:hypothetical protein